jgi:hypothetical protein
MIWIKTFGLYPGLCCVIFDRIQQAYQSTASASSLGSGHPATARVYEYAQMHRTAKRMPVCSPEDVERIPLDRPEQRPIRHGRALDDKSALRLGFLDRSTPCAVRIVRPFLKSCRETGQIAIRALIVTRSGIKDGSQPSTKRASGGKKPKRSKNTSVPGHN